MVVVVKLCNEQVLKYIESNRIRIICRFTTLQASLGSDGFKIGALEAKTSNILKKKKIVFIKLYYK